VGKREKLLDGSIQGSPDFYFQPMGYLAKLTDKVADIRSGRASTQAAALCHRVSDIGELQVLLLTSRDTGRWIIPKGNIELHESPFKCAKREAFEEAGVIGSVKKKPFGYFTYIKSSDKPPYVVSVHLLAAESMTARFREKGQRQQQWLPPLDAALLVDEPELKGLFRLLVERVPQLRQIHPTLL
jgi:8-oxo-dGTP pyrophosphatase MutT (NUDIX family)